jgi:hypothetical protein
VLDVRELGGYAAPVTIHLASPGLDDARRPTLLPAAECADPPVRIVAVATDRGGWYRTTCELTPGRDGYAGVLSLAGADSTGEVTVEAIVVRTRDAATGSDETFASHAGMRIADAPPLRVLTRDPSRVPGGALDVRWEDFRTSAHPERARHSERLFHLETLEPPVLWLNRADEDLVAVLESKGTRGPRAVMRDLVNQAIAMPVWYALVHRASMSITRNEDGHPTVAEGWRRGLLARIAPRLHPGVGKDAAYRRLLEDFLDGDELDASARESLTERMVLALQDELKLADVAARAVRELARR